MSKFGASKKDKEARKAAAKEMYSSGAKTTGQEGLLGLILGTGGAITGGILGGPAAAAAGWEAGQAVGGGIEGSQDSPTGGLAEIGSGAATAAKAMGGGDEAAAVDAVAGEAPAADAAPAATEAGGWAPLDSAQYKPSDVPMYSDEAWGEWRKKSPLFKDGK